MNIQKIESAVNTTKGLCEVIVNNRWYTVKSGNSTAYIEGFKVYGDPELVNIIRENWN